jgi:hypothetical protein
VETDFAKSWVLKLFFSANIPVENLIAKITVEREKNKQYLAEYFRIEQLIKTDDKTKDEPGLPFWLTALNHDKIRRQAVMPWCDETSKLLASMK